MAEKILNTRIQLKYDTLANWNASSFKLKAGELAIVTVGEMKDGSTHSNAQYPVLFKVGTGDHTFTELPFASALAADVHAWAKASNVKLSGKSIQFVNGDTVVKSIELNYITEAEAKGFIADALKAYSTTEQMNAAIKVETDRALEAESDLADRVSDLEAAVGEGGSVADKIDAAIADLDSTASKTAGADGLALGVTLVDGKVTSITGSIAANTYDSYGSAAAAQSAAEGHADAKAAAAETAAKAHADSKAAAAQAAAEAKVTALADGAVAQNTAAIAAINNAESGILAQAKADATAKANAAEANAKADAKSKADQALVDAKAYADDLKDAILGEGIKDTFDTLKEIQDWIEGDGVNATELASAIAAEAKTRGDEITRVEGLISAEETARENAVKGIQDQIDALGIEDGKVESAAKADSASSLDAAGVAQVQGIKVNNAGTADVANSLSDSAKAEVKAVKVDNAAHADSADNAAKLGGVAAANYALKTDAQGYANTAEQNAKDYVDAREIEINKYADQAEADAKAYADGLAKNYATAAQGAKADTALQSIAAGTGLKVSAKANNSQTIDIDESVVFVFDCGSASTLID